MSVRISIRARCTTLCDNVCQWLVTVRWFSPGTPVSSNNKTGRYDITEILLNVALNTIKQTKPISYVLIYDVPVISSIWWSISWFVVWGFNFNNYQDTMTYLYIDIVIDTHVDEYPGLRVPTSLVVFSMFKDLRWEVAVHLLILVEIVDHYCLNFLFITHTHFI